MNALAWVIGWICLMITVIATAIGILLVTSPIWVPVFIAIKYFLDKGDGEG